MIYSWGSGIEPLVPYADASTWQISSNSFFATSHLCGGFFTLFNIRPSNAPIYPSLFSSGIERIYFENSPDMPTNDVFAASIINLSKISKRRFSS